MAAYVVLPTPPLPPTKCHLMFVAFEGRLDPRDLHVLLRDGGGVAAALARLDLADARDDLRFEIVDLLLRQLAQLEAHLRVEEPLAQHGVVVELRVDRGGELVEHEPHAGDEQRVDDQHQCARSSFRRMLTKLYGGHGPVYLKVSFSYCCPI